MKLEHPAPHQIPALKNLWQECFGDDLAFIDSFFDAAFADTHCLCVWEDGQPLAAAYWMDCSYAQGRLAYIYAVATAPAHRGKGLCHQLMAAIHSLLLQQGYAGSLLVPGSPGLADLYRGMGYDFFGGKAEFSCQSAAVPAPVQALTAMQYQHLRRQYLPCAAVQLGDAGLRFLQAQASLAAGDGCLLAYHMENGRLFALELLGSTEKAPGILRALGAQSGLFRTPGNTPYAMFRPLQRSQAPSYFGFAFD